MKICVISSTVFAVGQGGNALPGYGGLEVIAWHCAKGLAARGHQVSLVAPQGSQCPGCEVIECLPPGFGEEQAWGGCVYKNVNGEDVRWPGYWPKMLEYNDKDSIIIDHSWNTWVAMLKMEGRLQCPILKVLHAPVNTHYQSLPPEGVLSFICISEDQKNHFEALHSPWKARVCYNGIDGGIYKPLNIPRSNRFLYLARFSSIKGPDLAIDACKKAGVGLDLIGDTSITNEPELFEHCKRQADGTQIRIIGSVPRGETVWWYSQAHALLHPTQRFREPFGLAPVESMLCETPVITWDYGAMRETVKHGVTGFLVNSLDEMAHWINTVRDGQIGEAMRKHCHEWALRFSIDAMVKRYEELCEEALANPW